MTDAIDALEPQPNPQNKAIIKAPPPRSEVSSLKDVGPEARALERDFSEVIKGWPEYQQAVVQAYEKAQNGDPTALYEGIIFTRGEFRWWVKRANRGGGSGDREIRDIGIKVRSLAKPQLQGHDEGWAFEGMGHPTRLCR